MLACPKCDARFEPVTKAEQKASEVAHVCPANRRRWTLLVEVSDE